MARLCDGTSDISVIVPCYNEESNVRPLCDRLRAVLDSLRLSFEVIFVDDGSRDRTFEELSRLHEEDERVKVVRFRRNSGQTPALAAGFDYAGGNVVIAIDADLQYQPEDIPKLLAKLNEGYDIASGWRARRNDAMLTRRLPSLVANRLMAKVSGVRMHDFASTFKAYRCDIVKEIRLYGEMHRFVPAIASELGARIAEVPVELRPREKGKSKYGLSRVWKVMADMVAIKFFATYSSQPLKLFGVMGLAVGGAGVGILLSLGAMRLTGEPFGEHQPLMLLGLVLAIMGVQFGSLGLIADMVTRTYHESQGKPIYHVREVLGDFGNLNNNDHKT